MKRYAAPVVVLLFAAAIFFAGISWGLPSSLVDRYLFGDRTPWTGKEILALTPPWGEDANRGADVAAHPLVDRSQSVTLNDTDAQRAHIVLQYHLYSAQPDEMITLRALAQMKPGKLQFDPKLYQYGGLWIYPVGALLKIASVFHIVHLTADLTYYLDHPEAFGQMYVVMRVYSAVWGLVGVAVMYALAKRISESRLIGVMAAIGFSLLPTVINAAHEAKPHLAGAVLGLIAIDLAYRAITSGKQSWAIAAGIACGAAAGTVLSGWLIVAILPVMAFYMPRRRFASLAVAGVAAVCIYAISNPYVFIHLLGDKTVLRSNIENSAAMYQQPASLQGVFHGLLLLFEGASTIIFLGLYVIAFLAWRRKPIAWLLVFAVTPGLIFFLLHATGKPGEYGRFALPADIFCVLAIAVATGVFKRTIERAIFWSVVLIMLLPMSASYVWHYGRETIDQSTRLIVAARLQDRFAAGARTLAIDAEPAPYSLPPVDLFRWKLVLLPRDSTADADFDVRVDPVDVAYPDSDTVQYWIRPRLLPTPISWAAKPFKIETPSK